MDEYQTLMAVAILLLCVGGALIVWTNTRATRLRAEAKEERIAQLTSEADAWNDRAGQGLTPISTRLILKDGEHAILEESSTLFETRAVRVYGGGGTRIGRVYVGGGLSESHQRVREIDQGTLTLTTARLVFDGGHENRNVALSKVLSVSPWSDAIEISTERRAKSQIYRVENPLIWCSAIRAIAAGKFAERRTSEG